MFDTDTLLQQAVAAFSPSDAVFARVKDRIRERDQSKGRGVVVLGFVNQDSEKIFRSVFKKHNKLMQKIA